MRLSTDFTDSEVFKNFAKIVEKEGMLNKTASNDYPEYNFIDPAPELDISLLALADDRSRLYGVTKEKGEDLINAAHPGGGTVTQTDLKPEGDLGKVETIVEQHKRLEDVATKLPTGKYAQLSMRLVTLAEKFEEASMPEMASGVTDVLQAIAYEIEITRKAQGEHTFSEEEGTHITSDPESASESVKAFESSVRQGNMQAQKLINQVRTRMGKPPIKEDGIMGRNTSAALSDLGVRPGSYSSWGELFSRLNKVLNQHRTSDELAKGPNFQGGKPQESGSGIKITQAPSGPPADAPIPKLQVQPIDIGTKSPPMMWNDDGMHSEAQHAPRAMTPEQIAEVQKTVKPVEDIMGKPTAEQLAQYKARKEQAARRQALENSLQQRQNQQGLAPRTLAPPSTETYKLETKIPTKRPMDTSGLPPRGERPLPKAVPLNPPLPPQHRG